MRLFKLAFVAVLTVVALVGTQNHAFAQNKTKEAFKKFGKKVAHGSKKAATAVGKGVVQVAKETTKSAVDAGADPRGMNIGGRSGNKSGIKIVTKVGR